MLPGAGEAPIRSSRPKLPRTSLPWLSAAGVALLAVAGLVAPLSGGARSHAVQDSIVKDLGRLRAAVAAYAHDTGELPPAVFDLEEGYDGGLTDRTFVPWRLRAAWRGPYLEPRLTAPAPACFWSLAEPCCMQDGDGDGQPDELWGRLHRAQGTLDDELALSLDRQLDDGHPDTGVVRITPAWIWCQLIER